MHRATISSFTILALLTTSPPTKVRDDFPPPRNTEKSAVGPMSAIEAAARFKVPDGFQVSVFAAEPDVRNPIAMAWDRRGRLWIAENYTYSEQTRIGSTSAFATAS